MLLLLLALSSVCSGIKYDGLKVKFGWSDALEDKEYFFNVPRTIHEAESKGWSRTERPKGPLPELQMYCPPGRIVCPLYHTAGFVAGLQMAVPMVAIPSSLKPERYLERWSASPKGESSEEFWTATQFYVSEDSLKAGAGPTEENGATLQNGAVWVKGLDGKTLRIPAKEAELNQINFKKQNCIPNMGVHYYYNLTRETDCDKLLPWLAQMTGGELLGVGFQFFGSRTSINKKQRQWFENVGMSRKIILPGTPRVPECYLERTENIGMLSIHVYYISEPWEIKCEEGDSIEPLSVIDSLYYTGTRFANQINDEFQKIVG